MFVAGRLDLSRTQSATLIATQNVHVNGHLARASYRVEAGDRVTAVIPPPKGREVVPESIPLKVLYEDESLLIVDKPAGMVVHPAPGHWSGTLVNALMGRETSSSEVERAGLVHRLDKETSGLVLVAKTDRAHRLLTAAIAARRVSRVYVVLAWGHLDSDRQTVDAPIGRDPNDRQRMAIVSTGRTARTDFMRLARFDATDCLRARLHSGRTHQIRVHLASIGHPVVGDDTYGGGGGRRLVQLPPKRHFLHAAWLVLRHPISGAMLDVRSPLPADLKTSLVAAAGGPASMKELANDDPLDAMGFYRPEP